METRVAGAPESTMFHPVGMSPSGLAPEVLASRYRELLKERLDGGEGHAEELAALAEEWARRDPLAVEQVDGIIARAEAPFREEMGTASTAEDRWRVEVVLLEARTLFMEACLRGRERRLRDLADKWRQIEDFPDTLAAVVDPGTLARAGLERLKGLLGLRKAALLELDRNGHLVPVAGDTDGLEEPLRLSGEASGVFLGKRKALYADELRESCAWEPGKGWGGDAVLVPLTVRKRVIGALLLGTLTGDGWEEQAYLELETAEAFAERLAVALENARLHEREQRKIRETLALLEMARVVGSTLDLEEILRRVVEMMVDVCPVTMCLAYLAEGNAFRPRAWAGFIEELAGELERRGDLTLEDLGAEAKRALEEGRAVTRPVEELGGLLPGDVLAEHGVSEALLQPLRAKGRTVGFLALFHAGLPSEEEAWEEERLAEAAAAQASLAVENASLYADIERSYFSTVQALAKAIEVKDPYTRGHSERVTTYALMIAEAMGLDERERQKLKYAATLHDIGKIGIAGRVLNKPGSLTEEEYTHVKTHPLLGDSIVEPVEFLQEPRPIILHHHERYDGNGYPDGLRGEDIPLCARILSVADAFEAMRSDRPYRKALPLEEARRELVRNAGSQFDPRVVEVFLGILDRHGGDPIPREEGGEGLAGGGGPAVARGEAGGAREAGGMGR